MSFELRPITPEELPAYKRADEYGFSHRPEPLAARAGWAEAELDRTVAAFDGTEIVGIGRNYSLELTLPGGAIIPTAAVSWISVRPTHRRRGVLRQMMTFLLEECARRGESVSMLTASEGGIYGRFGYGVATQVRAIEMQTNALRFTAPVTRGAVRMLEPEENAKIAPDLFDRVRAGRNGAVSRPAVWWDGEWAPPSPGPVKQRFDVVYEVHGRVDGYAMYVVDGTWTNGFANNTVAVHDLVAATPEAEAALWQHVCGIDLTQRVTHWHVPLDTELPWLLADTRQMRTTALRDWLWLRPVDATALLAARRYATAERLVIEVLDPMRPLGEASGRFLLEGGPDGAACARTEAAVDIEIGVGALGSICLGGIAGSVLARVGQVEERTPGALAALDRMFAADRDPFAFTWF
jgi:predicted acetyltransferase